MGSRQSARKCHSKEQWCAQELAGTWSQQSKVMRGSVERLAAQQEVKATILILTTEFNTTLFLKHEHREDR